MISELLHSLTVMEKVELLFAKKCKKGQTKTKTYCLVFILTTNVDIFTLNNEPNTRYLSQENPGTNLTTRAQYPQKINVWAGIQ
jgi:hypothetical protein